MTSQPTGSPSGAAGQIAVGADVLVTPEGAYAVRLMIDVNGAQFQLRIADGGVDDFEQAVHKALQAATQHLDRQRSGLLLPTNGRPVLPRDPSAPGGLPRLGREGLS